MRDIRDTERGLKPSRCKRAEDFTEEVVERYNLYNMADITVGLMQLIQDFLNLEMRVLYLEKKLNDPS